MESTWDHYYSVVQKISFLTGMWPYLQPRTRLFRVGALMVVLLTTFVPQVAYQFTCKSDWQCSFLSMTAYLLSVVFVVKVYTFLLNIRKIQNLTEHLYVDWKTLETPEEYEMMKSYAENSRRFSLIYPVYCLTATCVFVSMSLIPYLLDIMLPLNESRPILLPYPGYYFVDSKKYFFYIFWHSLVSWGILLTGIAAHDCMFVSYVEHVCSMFSVVGFRFEYLFCNHDAIKSVKADRTEAYHKRIVILVHAHQEVLQLAQLLENTFTIPFAIQILISTIGISITLLQESNILKIIKYTSYVFGQLIHLFCLNFEGQKLIDHSLQMCDRIYNSVWYEAPVKSRKLLMMVLMKSFRPTFLSAGKVYVFSLENFTTVLQTSMSYFTVLASFQ